MIPKYWDHPRMIPTWSQHVPKMIPNWFQNNPKMISGSSQNDPNMISTCFQSDCKMVPKAVQDDLGSIQEWSQDDPNVFPKWFQHDAQIIQQWYHNYSKNELKNNSKTTAPWTAHKQQRQLEHDKKHQWQSLVDNIQRPHAPELNFVAAVARPWFGMPKEVHQRGAKRN